MNMAHRGGALPSCGRSLAASATAGCTDRAIEQVSRGEPSLHPSIAVQVLRELRRPAPQTRPPNALTAREVEVLRQVAKGLANREIAAQLVTTEATIKTHVSSILSKLHLANRVQATLYALQEGVSSLEDAQESPV